MAWRKSWVLARRPGIDVRGAGAAFGPGSPAAAMMLGMPKCEKAVVQICSSKMDRGKQG